MGIEDEVFEAIALVNLGSDGYGALETELAAELEVVEGEAVVGGFCPVKSDVSWSAGIARQTDG